MLRAAWLGDWKAPWGLDRGRRWGDPAWALAAISQAWLLGGHEGRWPRLKQEARRPQGPKASQAPVAFEAQPDPAWVALLRHGSTGAAPSLRGSREDELVAWAWEALLDGDGTPWMAAGSVLLDLPQRLRWVALLGAVDAGGTLHLPPYLDLVPAGWRSLPTGWWEFLLRSLDGEGRLLPEGPLDTGLPWPAIQGRAESILLPELPEDLAPHRASGWLHQGPDGAWMLDPRLRAWARGFGASPRGLEPLVPRNLGAGLPPESPLAEVLALRMPADPPPGWTPSLEADLQERTARSEPPPASGHPTWDRLRMRWGGEAAEPVPGYPAWGTTAHPCADPFHWMAEGLEASRACEPELALRAFTLAHAHFMRLGSSGWAARAASNAAFMGLQWADLPAHRRWADLRGPLPQPWHDHEAAQLADVYLDPSSALARIRSLVDTYPGFPPAWGLLAVHGLDRERWDLVREALPHVGGHPYARFLEAALGPLVEGPPEGADPEARLGWEAHRLFRGHGSSPSVWAAWRDCPNQVMRLELGLQVLERVPEERSALRLLALQTIADRADSVRHQRRLAALWPRPDSNEDPAPTLLFKDWLAGRETPTWDAAAHSPRGLGLAGASPDLGGLPSGLGTAGPAGGAAAPISPGAPADRALAGPPPCPPARGIPRGIRAPLDGRHRAHGLGPARAGSRGGLGPARADPGPHWHRQGAGGHRGPPPLGPDRFPGGRELLGLRGGTAGIRALRTHEGSLHRGGPGTPRRHRDGPGGHPVPRRGGGPVPAPPVPAAPGAPGAGGSDHAVKVDVRFIAATHRPLEELAAAGNFRRDLLFRLQGAVLHLPPLADRRHEFPYLLPRLAIRAAQAVRRPIPALAPGLPQALARRPWPGNVRELLHALERAILRCEDGLLKPGHFPELEGPTLQARTWEEATRAFQRRLLLETLQSCGFRVAEAAEALGLARPALNATAKRLGVDQVAERLSPSS